MKRHILTATALTVAVAAFGAGAAAGDSPPSATASPAKVKLVKTNLGKVLATGSGRTLYLFEKDKGRKSTCFGACAANWPPLTTTGSPKAGTGVSASKLGTTRRGHGVKQVTYNGHPVYRFVGDQRPRQTNGEGLKAFGAAWYALSAAARRWRTGARRP